MDDKNENVVVYPAFIFLVLSFVLLMLSFNGWVLLIAGIALELVMVTCHLVCKLSQ